MNNFSAESVFARIAVRALDGKLQASVEANLRRKVMKVLLQNRTTRLFFQEPDVWVADASMACSYASSAAALRSALRDHLRDTQIVLKFPKESDDITMAVHESGSRPARAY